MSITATICQPRYLPYPGYFDRMLKADVFIVLDCVQFSASDWENRNKIKSPVGTPQWLTVPVKSNTTTQISSVEIDNSLPWRRKHKATIEQAYARARYFDAFAVRFRQLNIPWYRLEALNESIVDTCCEILDINTPRIKATELQRIAVPYTKQWGTGSELLLNLCKAIGADKYISGAPGRDYLDEDLFKDNGVAVEYQDFEPIVYPQPRGEFIPNLAVIDMIYNCGDQSKDVIRGMSC